MREVTQLSLAIFESGRDEKLPDACSITVSGKFEADEDTDVVLPELYQDEVVMVQLLSQDGEIIASGHGRVNVGFRRKETKEMSYLVREQKVKLGA